MYQFVINSQEMKVFLFYAFAQLGFFSGDGGDGGTRYLYLFSFIPRKFCRVLTDINLSSLLLLSIEMGLVHSDTLYRVPLYFQ